MRQVAGYSLVEVTVVIGIAGVLMALGTPRFRELLYHYRSEAQVRAIYGELLQARARALYLRRPTRIRFYTERFEVYSTAVEGTEVAPVMVLPLEYPVMVTGNGNNIDFDTRGVTLNQRSICIANPEGGGGLDAVVIGETRVSLGKKEQGEDCASANITKY